MIKFKSLENGIGQNMEIDDYVVFRHRYESDQRFGHVNYELGDIFVITAKDKESDLDKIMVSGAHMYPQFLWMSDVIPFSEAAKNTRPNGGRQLLVMNQQHFLLKKPISVMESVK